MGLVITTIILGIGVAVVAFFLLRSLIAPKRIESVQALIKQDKPQQAIKAARQLLAKDTRNGDLHYLLALAYEAAESPELALAEYKTVNEIGNFTGLVEEVPFRKKIAALYADFNQPEEALKEYLLLVKREPESAENFLEIGRLFESRSRSDRAMEFYRRSVKLDNRNADAHSRLGVLLYRDKHTAEARAELDAAVRINPEDYNAWYYIGRVLKDNKDCVVALTAFEKAARDPELKVKALIERGGCLINLGNTQRAISELSRAADLADDNSNEALYAHYFLAHAYEKTRRIELAVDHWEFIYRRKPTFKDVTEKFTKYQDLRTDDRVKDYLTAGQEEFCELCKRAATTLGLTVRDTRSVEGGCEVVAVEQTSKWRNARSMPKLLRFLRTSDSVNESSVRDIHEEMKRQHITRGMLIASSSFTRNATDFAQSRPIDLLDRNKLQALLQKVEM